MSSKTEEYKRLTTPVNTSDMGFSNRKKVGLACFGVIVIIIIIVCSVVLTRKNSDAAELSTSWVDYYDSNGTILSGYLAYQTSASSSSPRPGVAVAPYWGGIGPNEINRTETLARNGYIAFAIDVYGKGVNPVTTADRSSNATFLRNNPIIWRDRANAGLNVLIKNPLVNPNKLGAAGYCLGGTTVMELARSGAPVLATVSFHGDVSSTTPNASLIKGQTLACNGQNDTGTTPGLPAYISEMNSNNITWNILNHKDAVHCFTDFTAQGSSASASCAYNYKADVRAHQAMFDLFDVVFNETEPTLPNIELVDSWVDYNDSYGNVMEGYLVYAKDSNANNPRPGVAVNHYNGGIGPNEIYRSQNLARAGYIAFAVDVFGKGIRPTTSADKSSNTSLLRNNITLWRDRANAGLNQLINNPLVNPSKLTTAGYCFGGSTSMELARSGADISAAVSFHGSVNSAEPNATAIKAQLLACNGQNDTSTTASLQPFMDEMNSGNVSWNILNLAGAVHCFTDQSASGSNATATCAYNHDADQRSHDAMFALFREVFM